VRFDDIMDALRTVGRQAGLDRDRSRRLHAAKLRAWSRRRPSGRGDRGSALH
jgi:hypothetical protein